MDSKLVVEQMSGRWQVKHPAMKPLAARGAGARAPAAAACASAGSRGRRTRHADRLANEAMDAAARGDVWRAGGDSGPADAADAWLAEHEPTASLAPAEAPVATPQNGWRDDPSAPPTTALLLRHGQTELSVQKRFSGTGDQPLTEHGRLQAAAAAARLADAAARRPSSAAPCAGPARPPSSSRPRLGRRGRLRARPARDRLRRLGGLHVRRGQAEVAARARRLARRPVGRAAVRRELRRDDDARPAGPRPGCSRRTAGSAIVVVSHVTPIKTLLRLALDAPPSALYRMHLDLTCLSEVQWFADGPAVVRSMNDTSHVPVD